MRLNRRSWLRLLALSGLFACGLSAQPKPSIGGDYAGLLGTLHVELHITAAPDGSLSGTLDSIDQGAMGIACADFQVDGNTFSFRVPAVNGTWKGTVTDDGATLTGTWNQGRPMALNLVRDTFEPAEKPSAVDGIWLGTVEAGGRSLRAQIKVKSDRSGHEFCAFDSLDQFALGWECAKVSLTGTDFWFEASQSAGPLQRQALDR